MPVTKQQLLALLDEAHLHYEVHEQTGEPIVLFRSSSFRDRDGNHLIMIVVQLSENGEYVKFFLPCAYYLPDDESAYGALKTFASISWQIKMVDFELDINDGEVRPTIDFPIEDAILTAQQVFRCCQTLAQVVDGLDPFIHHAIKYGEMHEDLRTKELLQLLGPRTEEKDLQETVDELVDSLQELRNAMTSADNEDDSSEQDRAPPESESSEESSSDDDSTPPDYEWI